MNRGTVVVMAVVVMAGAGAAIASGPEAPWKTFSAKMKEFTSAYAKAPNDIKKSALFSQAREYDASFFSQLDNKLTDWQGKVDHLHTGKGGENLRLTIKVGVVSFETKAPIPKGEPVYNAAADLAEGQCAIFSGEVTPKEGSISEAGAMQGPEYKIEFSEVKPCKK